MTKKTAEILPGVFHWTTIHERIRIEVSSYYFPDLGGGVLLDPMTPPGGLDWFRENTAPSHILLSNRHHYRHSGRLTEEFGCTVWCHEAGMHEFTRGEVVEPFEFGQELPGGIEPIEIGSLCPEETAYLIPKHGGIIAFADGLIRRGDGPLAFVPDKLMGENPAGVKKGLKAAFLSLLDREFDNMLFAHGYPWIGGAGAALKQFTNA